MIHLAHRDEKLPETDRLDISRSDSTFLVRPACGQLGGFDKQTIEMECVGDDRISEVECRRCRRIHEHWKRVASND